MKIKISVVVYRNKGYLCGMIARGRFIYICGESGPSLYEFDSKLEAFLKFDSIQKRVVDNMKKLKNKKGVKIMNKCKRCGHKWEGRKKSKPLSCPRCKSFKWEKRKGES